MNDIATQIRARLDAIAAERSSLDEEERRLKKALDALEPTTPATSEAPGLEETLKRLVDQTPPMPPPMPVYPWQPHYPVRPWDQSDPWQIPLGPFCGAPTATTRTEQPMVATDVQSVYDFISQMCCGGSALATERTKAALVPDDPWSFAPEIEQCRYVSTCRFPISQQGPAY
jgi:hypothetical protein